jgi:hypothetical protein
LGVSAAATLRSPVQVSFINGSPTSDTTMRGDGQCARARGASCGETKLSKREHRVVAQHLTCEIAVAIDEKVVLVTVRAPPGISEEMLHASVVQLATAFAVVEDLGAEELQALEWERQRRLDNSVCWVLRRAFSDPDYPRRLDFVLRSIEGATIH